MTDLTVVKVMMYWLVIMILVLLATSGLITLREDRVTIGFSKMELLAQSLQENQ